MDQLLTNQEFAFVAWIQPRKEMPLEYSGGIFSLKKSYLVVVAKIQSDGQAVGKVFGTEVLEVLGFLKGTA